MKREHLVNVRIDRMALCASPAQEGATITLAKRRPESDDLAKGDSPGHEFRGNQHTDGGGGSSESQTSSARQSIVASKGLVEKAIKDAGDHPGSKHMKTAAGHLSAARVSAAAGNTEAARAGLDKAIGSLNSAMGSGVLEPGVAAGLRGARTAILEAKKSMQGMSKSDSNESAGENAMTPEQEAALKATSDAAVAEAAKAKDRADRIAALSTEEHAVFKALAPEKRDAFIALDSGARANEIAKSKDADPVVFTAKSGRTFRKSADPAIVEMAKTIDEQAEALAKSEAARADEMLKSRAEKSFTNLPFEPTEKLALVKALDGIADQAIRKSVVTKLDQFNTTLAKAFERAGVVDAVEPSDGPGSELEGLVKARMASHKEDKGAATLAVSQTDEGRALYKSMQARSRNGAAA